MRILPLIVLVATSSQHWPARRHPKEAKAAAAALVVEADTAAVF